MHYTIDQAVSAQIKILRSEFIAYLYPVTSIELAQEILKQHQIEHANATHNCYAYVLGYAAELQHYSDAGEPGGTAGKPMLNSLLRNNLSGVLAIVTRYYGGIKLGVKGLIEAYGEATQAAIDQAILSPFLLYRKLSLTTDYGFLDQLRHQMQEYMVQELGAEYTDVVKLNLRVPETEYPIFCEYLAGYQAMKRLDFEVEETP